MTDRTASLDRRLALTESPEHLFAEKQHLAVQRHFSELTVIPSPEIADPPSTPALAKWDLENVRLGEPGPIASGATAARFAGAEARSTLEPDQGGAREFWTLCATARLGPGVQTGTILSIEEAGQEHPVRALVVRNRKLGLLGWSWRGGQALWPAQGTDLGPDRWAHLAVTFGANGDLILFVDGHLERVFSRQNVWRGRRGQQRLRIGKAARFADAVIPGWRGWLQNVELYDNALSLDDVKDLAHDALGIAEPPPPAPRASEPIVHGCEIPGHQPAWRRNAAGELFCRRCTSRLGCAFNDHRPHWRPVGDVFSVRGEWELECGLCIATAAREAAAVSPSTTTLDRTL